MIELSLLFLASYYFYYIFGDPIIIPPELGKDT